jgi:hypothetical protein
MFLPIIHNMQASDPAYAAAQHYNALIGNKPKINAPLAIKLAAINAWQVECSLALDAVKEIIGQELNALSVEQIIGNPDAVKLQSTFNQLARMGDNN